MIIAIDGPAGSGKSTVSKRVANKLGFFYLDTGAMYRALTLEALRQKLDLGDQAALVRLAKETKIDLEPAGLKEVRVRLNGDDVTRLIRDPGVTNKVKFIACVPGVRHEMVSAQQRIAHQFSVVLEGRDTTTVVFPNADLKIYLDADQRERAKRRFKELEEKDVKTSFEDVLRDQEKRDRSDFERSVGPLKKAPDAVVIDTTNLSIDEVVERVISLVDSKKK